MTLHPIFDFFRLIVNEYESMKINEIVLPNGTKYKEFSTDIGNVHNGDMREYIGKVRMLFFILYRLL